MNFFQNRSAVNLKFSVCHITCKLYIVLHIFCIVLFCTIFRLQNGPRSKLALDLLVGVSTFSKYLAKKRIGLKKLLSNLLTDLKKIFKSLSTLYLKIVGNLCLSKMSSQ